MQGGTGSELSRRELLQAGAVGALGLWLPFTPTARAAAEHAGFVRTRVGRRALAELSRQLRGTLVLPSDSDFSEVSEPKNLRYERIRPLAVAACAGEGDVVRSVNWAREHDVQPVVRGGGHSYAGFCTNKGLVIDISKLNRVVIDKQKGTAVVGGAAANANALAATLGGEWVLPGGTCLPVCYGGLTLGGGIGFNTHWAGLSCDHLLGSRIITADGKRLEINKRRHSDLFWACRGGAGGNFGVNTQLTFKLAKIPVQDVAFYSFNWRGADAAAAVLAAYDKLCETAPPAFNADTAAVARPIEAGGPREAIDVFSRGQYLGPLSELQELVAPLMAAAPPTSTQFETLPYWDMQQRFATPEQPPHAWGDISRYATGALPDSVYGQIGDLLADCPTRTLDSNGSMWSLGWVGGDVVNSIGRRETAYVHRGVSTLLRATPDWDVDTPPSVQDGLLAWTKQMIGLIEPHTPNESYQNFPSRDIKDPHQQYYGENLRRLVTVKTKYDPDNVFRNPQSIPVHRRGRRR